MPQNFDIPILLLIFNRPELTQNIFNQIRIAKPLYLYVAADGPRNGKEDDYVNCQKTRDIINQVDWDCNVKTLFRNENLGCGLAVCSAISWFFNEEEAGIILEDDCLPHLSFFSYCKELLNKFKEDEDIFVISGTNLQNGNKRGNDSYYFSNYPITWGWATWRRAWKHFKYEIREVEKIFVSGTLDHAFQSKAEKTFWQKKLKQAELHKEHIWDYQWFYAVWQNKGLGITPETNLIVNIGFDKNGTHTFLRDSIREPSSLNSIQYPLKHPPKVINQIADFYTFKNAFSHSPSRIFRLIRENGLLTFLKYTIHKFVQF